MKTVDLDKLKRDIPGAMADAGKVAAEEIIPAIQQEGRSIEDGGYLHMEKLIRSNEDGAGVILSVVIRAATDDDEVRHNGPTIQ